MKARRKLRQSKSHGLAWMVLIAVIAIGFVSVRAVGSVFAAYNSWLEDLPEFDSDALNYAEESYMYASDGETLLAEFQLEKRDPIELSQVSDYVIKATIDTEDIRFYDHDGVDYQGIARAVVNNIKGGALEGASTITQQLVKNTTLSDEANDITLRRKAREAELALKMEEQYSKEEILTMYLNTINYGDGCYGIEAAAQNYFQVSAADLTLAQAATLAGIPQSPTENDPKLNPDNCLARRNLVLNRMLTAGDITQEEYEWAISEDLNLNPAPDLPYQGIFAYPYFTSFVRDELMKEDNIYGCSYQELFAGGLKIYTTLDTEMQDLAEEACAVQYDMMEDGLDCAIAAIDPTNGYVKAIVGGRDFYTDQWNIAVQGGRPSGSTFKVFTLTAAVEQGISPLTPIDCSNPVTLTDGTTVNNFGNATYGTRTIQSATAISSNTGYYRLSAQLGAQATVDMAHRMGIDSDLSPYPIITLGTENVTPLEMAEAYSTLASGGIHHDPVIITRIENKKGEVLYEADNPGERVLDEQVAAAVTKVLRTVFESPEATAYGSGPSNGQPVAGKTGTGMEFRDHWLVGYSPTLTCAAWIGNRDYSSTSSSLTANALWQRFMSMALSGTEVEAFPVIPEPTYTNGYGAVGPYGYSYYSTQTTTTDDKEKDDSNNKDKDGDGIDDYITETDATAEYSDYTVQTSYISSYYPAGTVLTQQFDTVNKIMYITVSLGPAEGDAAAEM